MPPCGAGRLDRQAARCCSVTFPVSTGLRFNVKVSADQIRTKADAPTPDDAESRHFPDEEKTHLRGLAQASAQYPQR
jgi:hypothetical protein